ncbi:MAG TPA: hypothetical protein VL484_14200 [Vicinamibacterales bacterium]|nr:hypothetical protein [Vicinamibacterales bacterium]
MAAVRRRGRFIIREFRRVGNLERPHVLQNVADAPDFRAEGLDAALLAFMRDIGLDAAERANHGTYA